MKKGLMGLIRPLLNTALLTAALAGAASAATPWLHTSGNWIQDPNNNNVTLRGVSVVCPEYLAGARNTNQIIDTVANSGTGWYARMIRLAICTSGDPNADFAVIDPIVQHCIAVGLYVDIDLHFVSDYGSSSGQIPQSQVLAFWNSIAPHYANNSNVIFELYNEPVNPADWSTWKAYIQPVVNAVRTVAPNNLILMGSPQWSTYVNQAQASPLTGGNIVYVFHYYPNQGAPTTTLLDGKFGTSANSIPVVLGEFGWQNPGDSVTTGTTSGFGVPLQTYMEAHKNISWISWVADNPDTNWIPIMFDASWNILGGDNYQGQFIHDWLNMDQNDHQPGGATVPSAPTGLTASSGNGQAGLSWTASSGATSYNALRSTISGSGYASVATGIAATSYTNTGLTNGSTYYFVVTATNSAGTSGNSAQSSAAPTATVKVNSGGPAMSPFAADAFFSGGTAATNWTGTIDTSDVTNPAPQAVYQSERYGNVTYTFSGYASGSAATVRLHFCENWVTGSGQRTFNVSINGTQVLTNFDIYAATGAQHKANIQQFSANANSSGQYIIATTGVTNSALTNGIEILPAASPPPVPTGLTATAGNAQVALSWNASSGATAYDVKRSTVSGSGYATVSSPTTTSYTNTGLTNGTTYYFVVDAVNASGTSANSSQVSATPAAGSTQAQIPFATTAPVIDGTVDSIWSSATAYSFTHTTGTISGASDCSGTWKALWDNTNLYVLYDITDDVKMNDSVNVYDDDSVELYLDSDHNGGTTYDANDRQIQCGWGDTTPVEGGGRSITGAAFAKSDPLSTEYRIELKVPWSATSFTPSGNAIIGIDAMVNDDDDGGAVDGKIMWNDTTNNAWNNPSVFGTGKLLPGSSGNTHGGTWAAKGVLSTTSSWTQIQQWANVASNSTYTASFWMKGTGGVVLILQYGAPDYAEVKRQTFTATSTWTQYSFTLSTTGHTQLLYRLADGAGISGTIYLDDTFLGVLNGTNTLVNPGFESGNTTWTIDAGAPFSIVQNP